MRFQRCCFALYFSLTSSVEGAAVGRGLRSVDCFSVPRLQRSRMQRSGEVVVEVVVVLFSSFFLSGSGVRVCSGWSRLQRPVEVVLVSQGCSGRSLYPSIHSCSFTVIVSAFVMCIPDASSWYIVIMIELINSHRVEADPLPCPDPCSGVVSVS